MATTYPARIDNSASLPSVVDGTTSLNAGSINRLRDAIVAAETELGVKPSGLYTTVRQRLDAMDASIQSAVVNGITFSGDLSGTVTHQTVVGIQTKPVSPVAPTVGQTLIWDGGNYTPSVNFVNGITTSTITVNIRLVTANYTVDSSGPDYVIGVGILSVPITITLPVSPTSGRNVIIKDINGSAASYTINISGNGKTIDGVSIFIIAQNYTSMSLVYNGTSWSIL